jgi:AP-4 complex subunit beta-1
VNELKVLMKNSLNEKDDKKKREVVKKVIAYMTLGNETHCPSWLRN